MTNQPERRADSSMMARIDERTIFLVDMAKEAKEWREQHTNDDQKVEDRVVALEKQNSRQAGAMWVITGLAGFLGLDRVIGMFK